MSPQLTQDQRMAHDSGKEGVTGRIPAIGWILLLACLLRTAAVAVLHENLTVDRDAYLAIAQNMLEGHGYCSTPGQPTAFRPPLYPLLLAACMACGGTVAIGIAQILLGTATVWLTWLLSRQCRLSTQTGLFAATLVAVDPLLIHYSTQAMTETLSTFLAALLLVCLGSAGRGIYRSVSVGMVFGLAALCRPSMWAFGGLIAVGWIATQFLNQRSPQDSHAAGRSTILVRAMLCAGAVAITLSPWVIRNTQQFGHPILMTTHGGYTLLLGNNETFFQQVVDGKPGATWQDPSLRDWQAENERKLEGMGIAQTDEVSRDTAIARLATTWIIENPLKFMRACVQRIRRFWSCWPSASSGFSSVLVQLVGVYYLGTFALAAVGAFRWKEIWSRYWALPVLVLALTVVHSVYWSNARMRSAVVPAISLATAAAFQRSKNHAPKVSAFPAKKGT
jgi:hypothetical protein